MMTPRKIVEFIAAEPFRPFRIRMGSGRTFDVVHPEMIMVGRSSVTVHHLSEYGPSDGDWWQEVSLMLLESVEPLEARTTN